MIEGSQVLSVELLKADEEAVVTDWTTVRGHEVRGDAQSGSCEFYKDLTEVVG